MIIKHKPQQPAATEQARASWTTRRAVPPTRPFPGTLSVVIAAWNGWNYTRACLDSLFRDAPDAEVIVVDNGSTDETRDGLLGYPGRVVRFAENRGVAPAWNAGLRQATGAVLCVLNNDTTINPGGMLAMAEAAWRTGIACHRAGRIESWSFAGFTESTAASDYPDGCCLAFRCDVWQAVGEFDEAFAPAYGEDTDWGLRARERGYTWEILPHALRHVGSATSAALPGVQAVITRNREQLRAKHSGKGLGERILLRRWAAMGDVLMALPVLHALRQSQPLARIHFQCAPPFAALLSGAADADVVASEAFGGYTREINLDGVYERRQAQGQWEHPAASYAAAAGLELARIRYCIPDAPDLSGWAEALLPEGPLYVACGVRSACRQTKANWHPAGWAELARICPEFVFVPMDARLKPSLGRGGATSAFYNLPNVLDLTGRTPSLRHLYALLLRCRAAVAVDTGAYHLAAAAGLPVVGLFGGVPSAAREPLVGHFASVDGEAPCTPCQNACRCARDDGPHCLAGVTGKRVASELRGLLGGHRV